MYKKSAHWAFFYVKMKTMSIYLEETLNRVHSSSFINGGSQLLYKGNLFPLVIRLTHLEPHVVYSDKSAVYYTPYCDKKGQIEGLMAYYKVETQRLIHERLPLLAKKIGVTYNHVSVKNQKTRWGSCSSKQNLNFNLRLAMMPEVVAEYIMIHELCHLKEMNHSGKFWGLVSTYCPNFEMHREWLRFNTRLML